MTPEDNRSIVGPRAARTGDSLVRGRALGRSLLVIVVAACGGSSVLDSSAPQALAPPKDAIAKTTENGPVKATVKVWPAKPTLGDPIYLRLEVDAPSGISVDAPFQEAGDQRMGRFHVAGFTKESQRKPDGGQHQEQTYTLEASASGKQRIPPLRLEMVDARPDQPRVTGSGGGTPGAPPSVAGKPQEIMTEEIPFEVAPVATEATGKELHAASGKLDPDVGGTPWLVILGIASALAVLGSGSVLALRAVAARRKLAKQRSAYDEAIAQLRELEERGAPDSSAADAWFVRLSSIVRGYLERRYDIRAPELTTEEFLQEALRAKELTAEHRTQLTAFLEGCDRVKFAGYRPETAESLSTLAAARGFVEDTRLREEAAA